jgi:hypothetical protein
MPWRAWPGLWRAQPVSPHLLPTHGFPPSSSASADLNCCPRPATSHTSEAAASLARNRCRSRISVVAAALAGPTHGGQVGRLSCTGRLLAGGRRRWRRTGLPNRSNIAWHNQPMANAAMIEAGSLIMFYCIVIDDDCLALSKMNKMRNQLEQMINGKKARKKRPQRGGSEPEGRQSRGVAFGRVTALSSLPLAAHRPDRRYAA